MEISSDVRDLLFDGCEKPSTPNERYTGIISESYWLPFSLYYTGTAECSDGGVNDLPPGMSSDSICNIYGAPNTVGVYLTEIELNDGSQCCIELSVNGS